MLWCYKLESFVQGLPKTFPPCSEEVGRRNVVLGMWSWPMSYDGMMILAARYSRGPPKTNCFVNQNAPLPYPPARLPAGWQSQAKSMLDGENNETEWAENIARAAEFIQEKAGDFASQYNETVWYPMARDAISNYMEVIFFCDSRAHGLLHLSVGESQPVLRKYVCCTPEVVCSEACVSRLS